MNLAQQDPHAAPADPRAEAFLAIYRAEFAFVWTVARRFGVPPAALDDVVQEVFLTAYRRLHQLHFEVSPRGWLFAVTRRAASHHRRGASRRARGLAAFTDLPQRRSDAPHERHEAAQRLERLLAHLPRGTREVWELTEVLGMSGPEIAAELELPLNTVYSRLRLARARLVALASEPEAVAACITAVRRADAPPPEAAGRNWAVVLPMLTPASGAGLATIAGAWATSRAGMAVILIVAGTATIAVVPTLTRPTSAPIVTAQPPAPLEPSIPEPTHTPPTPPTIDPAQLAAEVALLDRARAHLRAGEPGTALVLLTSHARGFPHGALHDAREAARVEAHCLRGAAAEAEATARRLVAQFPDSLIARRFTRYVCAS